MLSIVAVFIFFPESSGEEFFARIVIISEITPRGVQQQAIFIIDQTSIPTLSFPSGTGSALNTVSTTLGASSVLSVVFASSEFSVLSLSTTTSASTATSSTF